MTNGDFIRAMDDNALALLLEQICHVRDEYAIQKLADAGIPVELIEFPTVSIADHLKWLKQEVSE